MPYFRFTGDRGDGADFLFSERIDDGGLAGVRIANETDRYLFAVGVERRELAKELDERAFAEGVGDGRMEGKSRIRLAEVANPRSLSEQ